MICGDFLLQVESRVDQGRVLSNCFTCTLLRKSITFVDLWCRITEGYFLSVITTHAHLLTGSLAPKSL